LTAFAGKPERDSGLRSATLRGAYALVVLAELVAAGFLDTVAKIGLYWVLTNRAP
jgi:hypothetical protein